jgi:hypothetical protein
MDEREFWIQAVRILSRERRKVMGMLDRCIANSATTHWSLSGDPIEEVERPLVEALERIRRAPRNESPTVAWMQRVAAWALEPHKWPKPESEPPSAHVVFRMGAQVSITDPVWSDEPVTTGWVEGYTEDGRCVVRLNDPERRLQTFAVEHLRHGWRPGVQ